MLEEDLPLLPFDQVVAGYEKEIAAGRIRHVFDLSLVYGLQPKAGQSHAERTSVDGLYYAKPFWRLSCLWRPQAGEPLTLPEIEGNGPYPDPRNNISFTNLLMDAQTGELIDPTSAAHDRAEYKGILTWEEVGGQ